jgi:hypothetical protein
MKEERKIDSDGKLLDPKFLNKSKFFELLESNDEKKIEEWLIDKGRVKPYCPFRYIDISKEDL